MEFARKIAESETFRRSSRLRGLLLHLCGRSFAGHPEELTEQQIGMAVFGRPADYDSANDNVVRVAARQLRIRLQEYFDAEGRNAHYILTIPKGSYIPVMRPRVTEVTVAPEALEQPEDCAKGKTPWLWTAVAAIAIATAAAGVALLSWRQVNEIKLTQDAQAPSQNLIRATVIIPGRRTIMVVGDSNLQAFSRQTGHSVGVDDYVNGRIVRLVQSARMAEPEKRFWDQLFSRPQVDIAALTAVARILQIGPETASVVTVQHAAEVRGSDFRGNNVILVGTPDSNPWFNLAGNPFNFQVFYDTVKRAMAIRNRDPVSGEPAQFSNSAIGGRAVGFSQIAFGPNPNGTGSVLLFSGTSPEAESAAVDFACHREAVPRLLAVLNVDDLQHASVFEAVLRVDSVEGISWDTQVVASRVKLRSKP
jgi:hypothetical protein